MAPTNEEQTTRADPSSGKFKAHVQFYNCYNSYNSSQQLSGATNESGPFLKVFQQLAEEREQGGTGFRAEKTLGGGKGFEERISGGAQGGKGRFEEGTAQA